MKNSPFLKLGLFSLVLISIALFSASILINSPSLTSLSSSLQTLDGASHKPTHGLTVPDNNCAIRTWYNYQVIAIPKLNAYWQEQGLSLEDRAKKAFLLRHNARKNARYMMPNQQEVAQFRARDQERYGNPDGPTFDFLVQRNRTEGKSDAEIYASIIASASRTNSRYNSACN